MAKTVVVLPTYNEAENLPRMISSLLNLGVPELDALVVDDSSPDGTGDIAEKLAREHPGRVSVLHREGKLGLGTAYVTGFKWAIENGADFVIQMDCDFSHPIDKIPEMLEKAKEYDVIIGSRYVRGGSLDPRWTMRRRMISSFGNKYARLVTGIKAKDITGGFKCFTRRALEGLPLDRVASSGFTFQVEMNYLCRRNGYRMMEVPIRFAERERGQSKMSSGIVLEGLWRVWQMRFKSY